MIEPLRRTATRSLEFGIYRDGDNNLDRSQEAVVAQALRQSAADRNIEFTVEDTTRGLSEYAQTFRSTIAGGIQSSLSSKPPDDMAAPSNLARFVARTLDNAQAAGAKQTWIELVDHGAGDGGGLQADTFKRIMPMPQIAQAIARGIALHAQAHPEDANRQVDGVIANQCLMATLGFADALSHAGVRWLAASPETMVSPGVPSTVAGDIERNVSNPNAMARSIAADVMNTLYGSGVISWKPAAAFDVVDCSRKSFTPVEQRVKQFNDLVAITKDGAQIAELRTDASSVQGMARFPDATPDMPWLSDRPALKLYGTIAADSKLSSRIRNAANKAENAIASTVLAHAESPAFAPFHGANYSDAIGPTVHFPVKESQIDPWAPRITETRNRFFTETDAAQAERVLA